MRPAGIVVVAVAAEVAIILSFSASISVLEPPRVCASASLWELPASTRQHTAPIDVLGRHGRRPCRRGSEFLRVPQTSHAAEAAAVGSG